MKLLIVSYYGLKDSLASAADSLQKLGFQVETYPLFRFVFDRHDKLENYVDHFDAFIKEYNPEIVLWWFVQVPTSLIAQIRDRHRQRVHILYCWDDPYVWSDRSTDIAQKAKLFDIALITCEGSCARYIENGSKVSQFLPPGFDPKINHPSGSSPQEYDCDISICCTNLYDNAQVYPDQWIRRKELVDMIASDPSINFHIYGPSTLERIYPRQYRGYAKYEDLDRIFNRSRINLCTHVCKSGYKYVNERLFLILGSGGLLLVDPVNGLGDLIDTTDECVVMEKGKIMEQIRAILADYPAYADRKRKGNLRAQEYTWDKWAQRLKKVAEDYISSSGIKLSDADPFAASILRHAREAGVSPDDWHALNHAFARIRAGEWEKIEEVKLVAARNPMLDINKMLKEYVGA
jgi:hypothetical protein